MKLPSLLLGLALIISPVPNLAAATSDGTVVLFGGRTLGGWQNFGGGKFLQPSHKN